MNRDILGIREGVYDMFPVSLELVLVGLNHLQDSSVVPVSVPVSLGMVSTANRILTPHDEAYIPCVRTVTRTGSIAR